MEKKSFGGLPFDVVFVAEQMLGVAFHARNVNAARTVNELGEGAGVMNRLAAEAADLVACASNETKTWAVVTSPTHAVGVRLESVDAVGGGRLATVGVYGLPRNPQIEVFEEDFDRFKTWDPSDLCNARKVLMGIVELWTSVPDPDNDLPVGRCAPIEKLETGDFLCVQFTGHKSGKPPFILFIEAADEAIRLMAASKEAA